MSDSFSHKILHFEIPPPQEVWNKIADQLEKEFKVGDIAISKKIYDYEINPPSFILENVLSALDTESSIKKTPRTYALPLRRLAIAAIAIGLTLITWLYISNSESSPTSDHSLTVVKPPAPNAYIPKSTDTGKNNQPALSPNSSDQTLSSVNTVSTKKPLFSRRRNFKNANNVKYASLNHGLSAIALRPISVSAPPIYDDNGNIIMDESLVSSPDENYIIVTSPNGEQTKISRKFLKMLSVLNGGSSNIYSTAESFQWKRRFEEWRGKLLEQASYIPTASNFLDIMDLKELIQENQDR